MPKTAEVTRKGPVPSKTGITAKMDFVRTQLAGKGLTRGQAVERLIKKYPDTSESYARSIIYSRCVGLDFVGVRNRNGSASKKAPAKKAPAKTPVKAPAKAPAKKAPAKAPVKKAPSKKVKEMDDDDGGILTDFD